MHCDREGVECDKCKRKLQCRKRKHVAKRENEAREIIKLSPTHEKPSQLFKLWVRQRFGERIGKLKGCVNLLNHYTAILDSMMKMVPFYAGVFGSWAELVGFIDLGVWRVRRGVYAWGGGREGTWIKQCILLQWCLVQYRIEVY